MDWDCRKCQAAKHDLARNCNGRSNPNFIHITKRGSRFNRCPKAWQVYEAAAAANLFTDWVWLESHQILPLPGGLLDQPAKFIEASNIFTGIKAQIQRAAKNG